MKRRCDPPSSTTPRGTTLESCILENPLPLKRHSGGDPHCSVMSSPAPTPASGQFIPKPPFPGFIRAFRAGPGPGVGIGPNSVLALGFLLSCPRLRQCSLHLIWVLISTAVACLFSLSLFQESWGLRKMVEVSLAHLFITHFHHFSICSSSLPIFQSSRW